MPRIIVKLYEGKMYMLDVQKKLLEAEAQSAAGKVMDADESLSRIRSKYHVLTASHRRKSGMTR